MDKVSFFRNFVRRTSAREALSRAARNLARSRPFPTHRLRPAAGHFATLTPDVLGQSGEVAKKTFDVATKTRDVATLTLDVGGKTFDVGTKTFDVASKTFDVADITFDVGKETFEIFGQKLIGKRLIFSNLRQKQSELGKTCRFHRSAVVPAAGCGGVPPSAELPARRRVNPPARTPAPPPKFYENRKNNHHPAPRAQRLVSPFMKTLKKVLIVAGLCQLFTVAAYAQDIETIAPVVVRTVPEAGSKEVAPGVTEIRVTFSKPMTDQSWSWSSAWKDSTPEGVGKPKYDTDQKTCALTVKLEPNKTYGYWINSQNFHGFKDQQGHSAFPYLLVFKTKDN